ncbi:hypothetical protein X907_0808 [Glycocaulis alkaliphilus]|uniref:Uncharacterized protein n=1 Tax=Glycocaulis alkaliphilus TaxID=1434191 RepID=A0A3T0E7P9_9PROT|nr:hypothetical protein X907_0808 [Glycocaulis alkaliphilus]
MSRAFTGCGLVGITVPDMVSGRAFSEPSRALPSLAGTVPQPQKTGT